MRLQIERALSVFAVATWADDERAIEIANAEIDAFILSCGELGQQPLDAVRELERAYLATLSDTTTGLVIQRVLKDRLATLTPAELGAMTPPDPTGSQSTSQK